MELAGAVPFERALKDPWIEEQIQRDIAIYETNSMRGSGNMPVPSDEQRYFDGMLYLMSMMHCAGEFRIIAPQSEGHRHHS